AFHPHMAVEANYLHRINRHLRLFQGHYRPLPIRRALLAFGLPAGADHKAFDGAHVFGLFRSFTGRAAAGLEFVAHNHSCSEGLRVLAASTRPNQPINQLSPPKGVTIPSARISVMAMLYRLPLNNNRPSTIIMPVRRSQRLHESLGLICNHTDTPSKATACTRWYCTAVVHQPSCCGLRLPFRPWAPKAPSATALKPAMAAMINRCLPCITAPVPGLIAGALRIRRAIIKEPGRQVTCTGFAAVSGTGCYHSAHLSLAR